MLALTKVTRLVKDVVGFKQRVLRVPAQSICIRITRVLCVGANSRCNPDKNIVRPGTRILLRIENDRKGLRLSL